VLLIDGVCKLVNVVIPDLIQVNLVSWAIFFSWGYDNNFILDEKWSFIKIGFQWTCFSLYLWRFSDVYIHRWMVFFIDVPTWCGEWRALDAFLSLSCAHFIGKRC
jgi:hypothetical protein